MPNARQYFDMADRRLTFLRQQQLQLKNASRLYKESAAKFDGQLERTWRELVGYLLPDVDEATLGELETKLSYPGLTPIRRGFDAELERSVQRRLELEGKEEVAHRDIVEARVTDQLEEISDSHARMSLEVSWWRRNSWHADLSLRGWFSDEPLGGWINAFKNWRAVSFLLRDAGQALQHELRGPDELRAHYRRLLQDFEPLDDLVTRLRAELEEIEALNAEHAELVKAPATLGKQLFDDLGDAIRDHIESAPTETLFEIARGDEHLIMFFKKLRGLEKQASYLKELEVTRIQSLVGSLHKEIVKLEGKVRKRKNKQWRGKFHGVSQREYDGMRNFKTAKWDKRHGRLDKLRHRITSFDRYEQGSFGEHYLWWDIMTKRARADDIYEVQSYRRQHGDSADDHPHAALEATLGAFAADTDLLAGAAETMADDMLSGSDDWSMDAS